MTKKINKLVLPLFRFSNWTSWEAPFDQWDLLQIRSSHPLVCSWRALGECLCVGQTKWSWGHGKCCSCSSNVLSPQCGSIHPRSKDTKVFLQQCPRTLQIGSSQPDPYRYGAGSAEEAYLFYLSKDWAEIKNYKSQTPIANEKCSVFSSKGFNKSWLNLQLPLMVQSPLIWDFGSFRK